MVAKTDEDTVIFTEQEFEQASEQDPTDNFYASVDRTVRDFAMTCYAQKKQAHVAPHVPRALRNRLPFRIITPEFLEFPDSSSELRLQLTDPSNPLIFISGIVNQMRISRVYDNGDWYIISSRGDAKYFQLEDTPMYLKECKDSKSVLHDVLTLRTIPARCPTPEEWMECVHVLAPKIVTNERKMFESIDDLSYGDDWRNWDPDMLDKMQFDFESEDRLSPTPLHIANDVPKLSELMQERINHLSLFDEVVVTEYGFTNIITEWTVYTHPEHHIFDLMASERNPCPCCTREYAMRTDCLQDFQFWHCREAHIYFLLVSPEMHDTCDAATESLKVAERIRQAMASPEYRASMKMRFEKVPASVSQFRTIVDCQKETVQEFTDRMTTCINERPVSINVTCDNITHGQPSDHIMNWQPWVIGQYNFTRENICSCSSCKVTPIFTNDKFGEVHYCPTINMHRRIIDVSNIDGIVSGSELSHAVDEAFTRQKQIRAKIFEATRYYSSPEYAAEEARLSAMYGTLPVEHPEWICSIKSDLLRSERRFAGTDALPELKWTTQFRTSGCNHTVCRQQRNMAHMDTFVHFTNQRFKFIGLGPKPTVSIISINTFRNVNHPFVDGPLQSPKIKYIASVKLTDCLAPILRDGIYQRLALGQDIAYEAASKAEYITAVSPVIDQGLPLEAVDVLPELSIDSCSWADMIDTDKQLCKERSNLIHVLTSDPSKFLVEHSFRQHVMHALSDAINREDTMQQSHVIIPTMICIYSTPLCVQQDWEKFSSTNMSALVVAPMIPPMTLPMTPPPAMLPFLPLDPEVENIAAEHAVMMGGTVLAHAQATVMLDRLLVAPHNESSEAVPPRNLNCALLSNICVRRVFCDNRTCTDIHWPSRMCTNDKDCWLYKQRRCGFLHTEQKAFEVTVSNSRMGFHLHPDAVATLPNPITRAGLKR